MRGDLRFEGLNVIQSAKKSDVINIDQYDEWVSPIVTFSEN